MIEWKYLPLMLFLWMKWCIVLNVANARNVGRILSSFIKEGPVDPELTHKHLSLRKTKGALMAATRNSAGPVQQGVSVMMWHVSWSPWPPTPPWSGSASPPSFTSPSSALAASPEGSISEDRPLLGRAVCAGMLRLRRRWGRPPRY